MHNIMAQAAASSVDIAISEPMIWFYGEMDTVFALALLLLALYGLRVWDSFQNYD